MNSCERTRDRLLADGEDATLLAHLESCAACARFARRTRAVRRGLEERHAGIEPDPGFAARVSARLRLEPTQLLGWAALRLLPATLAVVLMLGWFVSQVGNGSQTTVTSSDSDDLLSWVLEEAEP